MEAAIISGNSKKDIRLLISIAKKMGLDVKSISGSDIENAVISTAIKEGETGEFIDINEFLKALKN
jgi:hypothetical protein